MAAVVNALSHNGHKHGQNDQANDNCWCIHRRSLLGRGGDGGNGEGVLVVLVSADKEVTIWIRAPFRDRNCVKHCISCSGLV